MSALLKLVLITFVVKGSSHPFGDREATHFAKKFLVNYGFMFPEADDYFYRSALMRYQRQSGLAVSGLLDDETLLEMKQPRCNDGIVSRKGRWKRFGQYRRADSKDGIAKWELGPDNSLFLRWFISRYTNKLTKQQVSHVARRCFASWEKRSKIPSMPSIKLRFEEASSEAQADISILFAEGHHGDNHPFDGRADSNNILAHTFYPKYSAPRYSGDIHLDDAEDWTVSEKSYYGTKLENVLLHEIGHSLGLTHSFRRDALMYPVYNHQTLKRVDFDIDDKCALNWIYMITDSDAVDKETVLKVRLQRSLVPRCIEDNGVREHIERLLRIRLGVSATAAEDYANLSCKFLSGLYDFVRDGMTSNISRTLPLSVEKNDVDELRKRKKRQAEMDNFEADKVFDQSFYDRFFQFYAS